jgi:fructokinase
MGETPGAGRYIGIDLGGSKIEGVVLDATLAPVTRRRIPTERDDGYAHILGRITALVAGLRASVPGCEAIGIGTPGSISTGSGLLKNSNTTCLNGRPLLRDLETAIGLPVCMENDANCFTLAEARGGAGRGGRLVFGVILGTGVGGGIVWDGELWRGAHHIAGEWGHHCLDPAGPMCYCGRRGCVETFLSGPALASSYVAAGGAACPPEDIVVRARDGEITAAGVLRGYLERFGQAIANVVNIVDPDVIVLGGGLSNVAELYDAGRKAVAARVFNDEFRTPIVSNALGDSSGVLGAALLTAHGVRTTGTPGAEEAAARRHP